MPNDALPGCSFSIRQQEYLPWLGAGRWAGRNGASAPAHRIQSPADQGDLCECRRTNPNGLQNKCLHHKALEPIKLAGSAKNKAEFATFRREGYERRPHARLPDKADCQRTIRSGCMVGRGEDVTTNLTRPPFGRCPTNRKKHSEESWKSS